MASNDSATLEKRSGSQMPGIAFITGGARGLGNAIAVSFAKEGASGVVIVDILDQESMDRGKKNVEAYGTPCLLVRADVTDEAQVASAVAQAVEKFGRIDYAANMAGITGSAPGTSNFDLADFSKTMAINCTGVALCCKHEMIQMMKQTSIAVEEGRVPQMGSIVNAASIRSIIGGEGGIAYTTSKHAVNGITKTAALEGRKHFIRVNSVSPGFFLTDLLAKHMEHDAFKKIWAASEARQGRRGVPEEIGDAVMMLSSPKMSIVNGANLVCDNGFTINETAY